MGLEAARETRWNHIFAFGPGGRGQRCRRGSDFACRARQLRQERSTVDPFVLCDTVARTFFRLSVCLSSVYFFGYPLIDLSLDLYKEDLLHTTKFINTMIAWIYIFLLLLLRDLLAAINSAF